MLTINKNGHKINVNEKVKGYFWEIYRNNTWEPETFIIFDKYIKKDSTYIDIGAWIGPTVLYGAHLAEKTYAMEPDKQAYRYLKENLKLNPDLEKKITTLNAALTKTSGYFTIFTSGANSSSSLINPHEYKKSYKINGISIEDLFLKNNIKNVSLLKIDIEGYEYSLLPKLVRFLSNTLKSNKPTVYISLHRPFVIKELVAKYEKIYPKIMALFVAHLALFQKSLMLYFSLSNYKYFYGADKKRPNNLIKILIEKECTSFVATDTLGSPFINKNESK